MKKMIAAVVLSGGLVMGTAVGATAVDPYTPTGAKHVVRDVNKAVNKPGHLSCKQSKRLKARVKLSRHYGLIKPATAKRLLKKVNKDTPKRCR